MVAVYAPKTNVGAVPAPRDPVLLGVAYQAGRCSYRAHPYYWWRYGRRGQDFTRSDSAWLTQLTRQSERRVIEQVHWLWKLLANRGMPGILLERHLVFLSRRLARWHHDHKDADGRLLAAATELRNQRTEQISADRSHEIAEGFALSLGGRPYRLLYGTAELLVSAAADARAGATKAVESLTCWLAEPEALRAASGLLEKLPRESREALESGRLDDAWRAAIQAVVKKAQDAQGR